MQGGCRQLLPWRALDVVHFTACCILDEGLARTLRSLLRMLCPSRLSLPLTAQAWLQRAGMADWSLPNFTGFGWSLCWLQLPLRWQRCSCLHQTNSKQGRCWFSAKGLTSSCQLLCQRRWLPDGGSTLTSSMAAPQLRSSAPRTLRGQLLPRRALDVVHGSGPLGGPRV